jgi:calmodulin
LDLGFELDLKASAAAVDAFSPNGTSLKSLKIYTAQLYAEVTSRAELIKAFKMFDKKDTGRITRRSLRETATEVGDKISDDAIAEMIQVADTEHKGYLTEQEFVNFMVSAWSSR